MKLLNRCKQISKRGGVLYDHGGKLTLITPILNLITNIWATICKTVCPMLSIHCLSVLSVCPVCNVCVLWPNGSMDQDETKHAGRPRPWPHCVR